MTCLKSFAAAGDCDKIYMLDRCPDDWASELEKSGKVVRGEWGKRESLHAAFVESKKLKDDILFLEDDYIWRPDTLSILREGLDRFGFVSPYDHPSYYTRGEPTATGLRIVGNNVWRLCTTNTHTFAVKREILDARYDDFDQNQFDWLMYTKLAVHGVNCFVPTTSLATHLVEGKLAYNVNWVQYISKYVLELQNHG